MYSETITEPIRAELKTSGIRELNTAESVHAFMKDMKGTAAVIVNSVCGCAARIARPGFFQSLQHVTKPDQSVSVFAGVDKEAVEAFRTYLPGLPPSSPSLAFFREGTLVHFLGRQTIEGVDEPLLTQALKQVYDKFFGETVNESLELKDPFALLERDPKTLQDYLSQKTTTLLDCRAPTERDQGHIQPSTPLDESLAHEIIGKWDAQTDLTLYCTHGDLSLRAALYFRQNGFPNVFILAGGYAAWQQHIAPATPSS